MNVGKQKIVIIILLVSVVLINGCLGNENNKGKKFLIQNKVKYTFHNYLSDIKQVPVSGKQEIMNIIYQTAINENTIVFLTNESSSDSAKYAAVIVGIQSKLQNFFAQYGKLLKFKTADLSNENLTANNVRQIVPEPIIWIRGPSVGADENVVKYLGNNIILLEGKNNKGLELVSDALSYWVITARVTGTA